MSNDEHEINWNQSNTLRCIQQDCGKVGVGDSILDRPVNSSATALPKYATFSSLQVLLFFASKSLRHIKQMKQNAQWQWHPRHAVWWGCVLEDAPIRSCNLVCLEHGRTGRQVWVCWTRATSSLSGHIYFSISADVGLCDGMWSRVTVLLGRVPWRGEVGNTSVSSTKACFYVFF